MEIALSLAEGYRPLAGETRAGRSSGWGFALAGSGGFSLIEMLVGLAVLTILTALLATAFSNFTQVTSSSSNRIEASKQTRTIFDRMAFDIGSAVQQGRVRMAFRKNDALPGGTQSKNDVMVLLTDANTSDPLARMAKVGYAVGPYEDQSRQMTVDTVLRHVEPFHWVDDTTVIDIVGTTDAQPIAPGILRFELAFVDREGDIIADSPGPGATEAELTEFHENLSAVICTLATMDEDSLQKLTPAERSALADRLDDAVDGETPLVQWQDANLQDLPRPAQEGLRFHQRHFRIK